MPGTDPESPRPARYPILLDRFGILRYERPLRFADLVVRPLDDYPDVITWLDKRQHKDGFLYPPRSREVELDPATRPRREIPNTRRPAALWRPRASHALEVRTSLDRDAFRRDAGLFVIHLLAYLLGTRLQFADWWFDCRVSTKPAADILNPGQVAEPFLARAYATWRGWSRPDRDAMTHVLFMHSLVPGYERIWERFTFEYMVFDGLYALAAPRSGRPPLGRHRERIERLCDRLAIPVDPEMALKIVCLRNDLFHQVSFGGAGPSFSGHGAAYVPTLRLRDLNRRIFAALLGWDSPFVHTPWWVLDRVPFDY